MTRYVAILSNKGNVLLNKKQKRMGKGLLPATHASTGCAAHTVDVLLERVWHVHVDNLAVRLCQADSPIPKGQQAIKIAFE